MCEAGQAPTVKQSDGSGTLTVTSMGTTCFCVTSCFYSVAKKTISNVNSLMVVFFSLQITAVSTFLQQNHVHSSKEQNAIIVLIAVVFNK